MKSNYYKATITLAVVFLGFMISYPFHTTLWGGLIFSGCSAGLIGGLADWFAVSALFRRPLGIRPGRVFRTEIIPQNRERIFAALVEMVQDELLTKEILSKQLNSFDITHFLLDYFRQNSNQDHLARLLKNISEEILKQIDPHHFQELIEALLENGIEDLNLSKLINDVIEFMIVKGYDESLLEFTKEYLISLVQSQLFHNFLVELIENAYTDYENEKVSRKIISSFLPSPLKLATTLQSKSEDFIKASYKELMRKTILDFSFSLKTSPVAEQKIKKQLTTFFKQQSIQTMLTQLWGATLPVNTQKLSRYLPNIISQMIVSFGENSSYEQTIDRFINNTLLGWVDKAHYEIGRIVRNSLDSLSNDLLVGMLEARTGNDLQMIRINGSVVGGIAGIFLFLLNFLIHFGG